MDQLDGLANAKEVARRLNVQPSRVYELAKLGLLPGAVHLGRQLRFDRDKLEEFIDAGGKSLPGGWRRQPRQ